MIIKNVSVAITLSPEDLAREFSNLDSREQAAFFNHLALVVEGWGEGAMFATQISAVAATGILTEKARDLMAVIGTYADYTGGGEGE